MQYWKWDFPFLVMVPLLEMGVPFPVMVICRFWYYHVYLGTIHISNASETPRISEIELAKLSRKRVIFVIFLGGCYMAPI